MKGLQDRNNLLLDGRTVENKGKLILYGIILCRKYNSINLFRRQGMHSEIIKNITQSHEKPRTFKIVVKLKKNDSMENMKVIIKQKVNPTEIKVGVHTFKSLKIENVLIEASNKYDVQKISRSNNEKCGKIF